MKNNSPLPHRKNIRLKDYDYSSAGYYFVTICTENRKCLFGDVIDGEMKLTSLGSLIRSAWMDLPKYYPGIVMDSFIVMPNHLHGIVILNVGAGPCARPTAGQARRPAPTLSLPDVIQRFKSFTDHCHRKTLLKEKNAASTKIWQRNYYEHVIRGDESLDKIRQYITENPLKWAEDDDNPQNINYLGEHKIPPYN